MKKNTIFFILFIGLTFTLFSQNNCSKNVDHPGYRTITQVVWPNMEFVREYILYVPTGYDENVPAALIINMHGFGDCAGDYAETIGEFYEFNNLANQENIIVAYPQGAYRVDKDDHYWEPGDNGEEHIYENDVFFIEALVAEIADEFNVDTNKVYALGYSNGGMMAYSLACNNTELFAGIGIMSGVMLEEDCTQNYSIPIIVFHGIDDGVLPYAGNQWYQSTQDVVDFWLEKNNIPASSLASAELKNGHVEVDQYTGGNENTCLSLITINEEYDKPGDHVWFSEPIEGSTPNEIMWDFFSDNCGNTISTEDVTGSALKIFPNPFTNQVTILSDSSVNQSFRIYNLQGQLIKSGQLTSGRHRIELPSLSASAYFIEVDGKMNKLARME